ncbi:hypothetical protein GKG47_15760 [Lactonifactor sp. BIOML-A3]|uniref:polysaccharide pyruvyl transferase family protein n=1 Tax=unclassified Lactonifactor TaxID=2636670 RepID=UPI0013072FBA|nr:hypothetical protein [Lactonifactor sp. BIOML-A5]MSA08717.1 hypothetical protein [Lactonifactor sp. BIOML-A4]MSA13887.1 hypothetical protein [Lactonifactor sp. BIOML-A3]MSA17128.1 hypothetical protein [Lactonifactor sp. BIOML-A2]MSA37807.1 hypothetical protein [Lactonifactor sp. BIOML-A1]MSB13635.1 hypothetical protein [Lactonifactor sp. BIOML-A6]MSB70483.1 hypothetical protein [Lactonifactor sp. BIOML-A7]
MIDYRCPAIEKRENLNKSFVERNVKKTIKNILFLPGYKKKAKTLQEFVDRSFQISDIFTPENIENAGKEYSKVFVGSDIVWGRDITDNDYTYFLNFIEDKKKKYAFASSVGDYAIRGDENRVAFYLNDFQGIAVRENAAVEWLKSINGPKAEWVCDPTMLLTTKEWNNYIVPNNYNGKYVLVYFRDPHSKNLMDAKKYAKKNNCKVIYINYDMPVSGVKNVKPKSLNEFLGLIFNAQMIFTASYHGMLFSIYYNKEFLFYTRAHKSRVLSLANRIGVQENCGDEVDVLNYKKINYAIVNDNLQSFREESISILTKMLNE